MKENQRILLTRRLIHEALVALLRKKKIDDISITELCQTAGVNRATFYRHYAVPRDVLMEMGQAAIEEFARQCPLPRSLEEMRSFFQNVCSQINRHAELVKVLILSHSDQELLLMLERMFEAAIREMRKNLALPFHFREDDILLIASYSAGGTYAMLRKWILGEIKKTPEEIAALLSDLIFNTDWLRLGKQAGLIK